MPPRRIIDQPLKRVENRGPESAVVRMINTLFGPGGVIKTGVDGGISWTLPCNLDTGLESNPLNSGEALMCYFKRLAETANIPETIGPDGPPGPVGPAGTPGWTRNTVAFTRPVGNVTFFLRPEVLLPFFEPQRVVFVEGLGWARVLFVAGPDVYCSVSVPIAEPVATIAVGSRIVVTGREGIPSDYTIPITSAPTFSPLAGTYQGSQSVALTSATPGATIYYTTNGGNPSIFSTPYDPLSPIQIPFPGFTIRAIAKAPNYQQSSESAGAFTITKPAASPVIFSQPGGDFIGTITVELSTETPGVLNTDYEIRYTLDGNSPTSSSFRYAGPITLTATTTIRAVVIGSAFQSITPDTAAYVLRVPQCEPVVITPGTPYFETSVEVTMTTATSGATIYYTTDGSPPTTASAVYNPSSKPVLTATAEVKAIAVKQYYADSNPTTQSYTLAVADTDALYLFHGPTEPLPTDVEFVSDGDAFTFTGGDLSLGGSGIGVGPSYNRDILLPFTAPAPEAFFEDATTTPVVLVDELGFDERDENNFPFKYITVAGKVYRWYMAEPTDGTTYGFGILVSYTP